MKLTDIPQFTRTANWKCDVGWSYLEEYINNHIKDSNLNLEPDFQRAHVWTQEQQSRYVEFILRGGNSGKDLYFNCKGWNYGLTEGPYVIVDGKQRLEAVRKFLRNELSVFANGLCGNSKPMYKNDFELTGMRMQLGFKWHVNDLNTEAEVLQWYLDINSGGVVHTEEELNKVRKMLIKSK